MIGSSAKGPIRHMTDSLCVGVSVHAPCELVQWGEKWGKEPLPGREDSGILYVREAVDSMSARVGPGLLACVRVIAITSEFQPGNLTWSPCALSEKRPKFGAYRGIKWTSTTDL